MSFVTNLLRPKMWDIIFRGCLPVIWVEEFLVGEEDEEVVVQGLVNSQLGSASLVCWWLVSSGTIVLLLLLLSPWLLLVG